MDLSTLDKRREACETEIAVNRPLAPDIYLSALPIVRQGQTFAVGGNGESRRMGRRHAAFRRNENARPPRRCPAHVDSGAGGRTRPHGGGEPCAHSGGRCGAVDCGALLLHRRPTRLRSGKIPACSIRRRPKRSAARAAPCLSGCAPLLEARGAAGLVRRGHGDLHLGNVALIDGHPVRFRRHRVRSACRHWRCPLRPRLPADGPGGTRPSGPPPIRCSTAISPRPGARAISTRPRGTAAVHVAARRDPANVEAASAERLRAPKSATKRARLPADTSIARSGFSPTFRPDWSPSAGSPASARARSPARSRPEIGRAPGALWLRSDLERKAMFGVEETVWFARLGLCHTTSRATSMSGSSCKARTALRAGQAVLLDATFAAAAERTAAAAAAADVGVAFAGLFLDAASGDAP